MKSFSALLILAGALLSAPLAKADSIVLESHVGNQYSYGLTIDHSPTYFILDGFELSNLTGVTNAALSGDLADSFYVTYNSHTVDVFAIFDKQSSRHVPFTIGTLTITSTAAAGPVDFSILDSNGYFTGSVIGPNGSESVPAVPEPSTLMMMGTGLFGAAGAVRRKLKR